MSDLDSGTPGMPSPVEVADPSAAIASAKASAAAHIVEAFEVDEADFTLTRFARLNGAHFIFDFTPPLSLAGGIAGLGNFFGEPDLASLVPQEIANECDIAVMRVVIGTRGEGFGTFDDLEVRFTTSGLDWSPIPGVITFASPKFVLHLHRWADGNQYATLAIDELVCFGVPAKMGREILIDAEAVIPLYGAGNVRLRAALDAQSPISLTAIANTVFPEIELPDALAGLAVCELKIDAEPAIGDVLLRARLAESTSLALDEHQPQIEDLWIELSRLNGNAELRFGGTMEFPLDDRADKLALEAQASYTRSNGFVLQAEADFTPAMSLTRLGQPLLRGFGASDTHLPTVLSDMSVSQIHLSAHLATGAVDLAIAGEASIGNGRMELILASRRARGADQSTQWDFTAQAALVTGDTTIGLLAAFDHLPGIGGTMIARIAENGLSLGKLLEAIGFEAAGLDTVTLDAATLIHIEKAGWLIDVDLGAGINLSHLSLPGLPIAIDSPQPLHLSGRVIWRSSEDTISAETIASINACLPAGTPAIPLPGANASSAWCTIELQRGGQVRTLALAWPPQHRPGTASKVVTANSSALPPAEQAASSPARTPAPAVEQVAANPGQQQGIDLHRRFGPVALDRLDFAIRDGNLAIGVDGALSVGPIDLRLIDLTLTTPLRAFSPDVTLQGLGLAINAGAFTAGGMLLHRKDASGLDSFAGGAVIRSSAFTLAAEAAFGMTASGKASLFVYGALIKPFGGSPACFITGIAAGFGIHRRLNLPALGEVAQFPLVSLLMDPNSAVATNMGDRLAAATEAHEGAYFGAAAIRFTSFNLVDGVALLVARVDQGVEIDVVGTASITVPPHAAVGEEVLARADLGLIARLRPESGVLTVNGQLGTDSFILSRDCVLTGGFAIAAWMLDQPDGARAGEFVYSWGGYHPDFAVPEYFPSAPPRLGFDWRVSDALHLSGGLYYAFTPSCAMAGGALHADFHAGVVTATFDCSADFLINFKPFHYEARIAVRITLSINVSLLFVTLHFDLCVAAQLHLQGPPMTGHIHAELHVCGLSIARDVDFGAAPALPAVLSWKEFETLYLPVAKAPTSGPAPLPAPLSLSVTQGLLGEGRISGYRYLLVDFEAVEIEVRSVIPASRLQLAGTAVGDDPDPLPVRPCAIDLAGGVSLSASIARDGDDQEDLPQFVAQSITAPLPTALWGPIRTVRNDGKTCLAPARLDESAMTPHRLVGMRLKLAPPPRPDFGLTPTRANLAMDGGDADTDLGRTIPVCRVEADYNPDSLRDDILRSLGVRPTRPEVMPGTATRWFDGCPRVSLRQGRPI